MITMIGVSKMNNIKYAQSIDSPRSHFTRLARSRTYASPGPLLSRFCPLPYMPVARLATGLPGWPDRAGFAPAR